MTAALVLSILLAATRDRADRLYQAARSSEEELWLRAREDASNSFDDRCRCVGWVCS